MRIPNAVKTRVASLDTKFTEALALIPDLDTLSIDMEKSGLSVAEVRAVGELVAQLQDVKNLTRSASAAVKDLIEKLTIV